jgi:hypothetical protein
MPLDIQILFQWKQFLFILGNFLVFMTNALIFLIVEDPCQHKQCLINLLLHSLFMNDE